MLLAYVPQAGPDGGGQDVTKIHFLVMLISVFVGLSYTPRRNPLRIWAKR